MKKYYFFIILCYLLQSSLLAQSWHWINPTNGHHHLKDISFSAPDRGIAVADNGIILHLNNGIWTQAESPVSVNLNAVENLSPALAWAVGDNGAILKFNGNEWVQQESPTSHTITDVCFVDETHGWAVGDAILFYDGNSWQVQENISGLKTISFYTPEEGWAGSSSTSLYHFINGEWTEDLTFENGNTLFFNTLEMTGPSTTWLNGYDIEGDGMLYLNAGKGWQVQNAGGVNSGISFAGNQKGFGIQNQKAPIWDTYPSVYKFSDGNWNKEFTANFGRELTSVKTISENEAYICDTTGFIYHGLDGNWSVSNGFTTDSILDIDFTRANNGYFACGSDGLWHYEAGSWTNELKVDGYKFNKVVFTDDLSGWASAFKKYDLPPPYNFDSKLFSCYNGVWTEVTIPGEDGIYMPVSGMDITSYDIGIASYNMLYTKIENNWSTLVLQTGDSITAFKFMQDVPVAMHTPGYQTHAAWMSTKRLAGDVKGIIYYNDFLQDNWSTAYETATGAFNDLCVADYMNIYAVGDNGLIAHFDGQQWSEFAAVTSDDLLSVYMNEDNNGWAAGKNGTLLHFNGTVWTSVQSNTLNDLHKVHFYQNFGLIGGENGTLLSSETEMPVGIPNAFAVPDKSVLHLFPNPANEHCFVEFNQPEAENLLIQILDISGRIILSESFQGIKPGTQCIPLNVSQLNKGIYLTRIETGKRTLQGKLVIQKQ